MSAPLRWMLARLSRGVVLKREMPLEHAGARICLSPEASLKFWRRDSRRYDPALMALAKELVRPGAVVWAIGANVGLFALAAAFAAGSEGQVLAVEADPWVAGLLGRSAERLPPSHAPITVVQAAVCDRSGRVDLAISSRSRAATHLAEVQGTLLAGRASRVESVSCLAFDDLLLSHPGPSVLKIDVESAEVLVLRGAGKVLKLQPIVLCEVECGNVAAVSDALHRQGYELFDAEETARPRRRISAATFNTLAIPGGAMSETLRVAP